MSVAAVYAETNDRQYRDYRRGENHQTIRAEIKGCYVFPVVADQTDRTDLLYQVEC